ncbi:MAG: SGNH/GDSL hydrolase family protein [Gemmataceae bacterium]
MARSCMFLFAVIAGTSLHAPAIAESKPVRVLFIGNSYTYVNDLPAMLAALAKAGGQRPLEHDRETPGGVSFEKHWKDGKAAKKIAAGGWDFVVLQEQSLRPLTNRPLMFEFAAKLDAEIRMQNAKTLLYQTWSRQDAPDKQDELSRAYVELGKELKAGVVPVGAAWQAALKADPALKLHGPDKSHPSKAGTYLAACVFYAAIYDRSPEGLPGAPGGLSDADAKKLQAVAWKTVREQAGKK